jgi:hypothetical protein
MYKWITRRAGEDIRGYGGARRILFGPSVKQERPSCFPRKIGV